MKKISQSVFINAPVEKVWNTMLDLETYRVWTKPFCPTSYFEGSWDEGSEMRFLGADENGGGVGGMISRIAKNRLHEFVSIEHLGMIKDGVEDFDSPEVKAWTPAFENYTFTAKDGGTEVLVELDTPDDYAEMFEEMWPKALEVLKGLAEKS